MAEKSIKQNAAFSFIKALVSFISPMITFPYASRILMPEGIGKVNFALSIVMNFALIAGLGVVNYATREASKIKEDKKALSIFSKEIISINMISTLIAYVIFLLTIFVVPKFSNYRTLLIILSTYIICIPLSLEWLYSALEEFKYVTIRNCIFQIIAIAYLLIFVRTKDDTPAYAFFGVISSVGCYTCNFIHSRKYIDFKVKAKLNLKKHIKPIFTFFGMSVITTIYSILDSTMLGFLSNDTEVGYYSAAIKISKMSLALITNATLVLLPRLSSYVNENRKEDFNNLVKNSLQVITFIAVPMTFGLIAIAQPLIVLFSGPSYIPATSTMILITPIVFALSISYFTGTQILPAISKEKVSLYSYIAGALTNFTANFILIPKLGAFGAAISTVAAESIVAIIQFIYLRKMLVSKKFIITLLETLLASVLMLISIHFFLNYTENILIQVFVSILIGMTVYFVCLLLMRNTVLIDFLNDFKHKFIKK